MYSIYQTFSTIRWPEGKVTSQPVRWNYIYTTVRNKFYYGASHVLKIAVQKNKYIIYNNFTADTQYMKQHQQISHEGINWMKDENLTTENQTLLLGICASGFEAKNLFYQLFSKLN